MAAERARADVRADRDTWITQRQPRMLGEPHRLVFVDETAVTTKLIRLRGRNLRGRRARRKPHRVAAAAAKSTIEL